MDRQGTTVFFHFFHEFITGNFLYEGVKGSCSTINLTNSSFDQAVKEARWDDDAKEG
jgi:hypothetical protein